MRLRERLRSNCRSDVRTLAESWRGAAGEHRGRRGGLLAACGVALAVGLPGVWANSIGLAINSSASSIIILLVILTLLIKLPQEVVRIVAWGPGALTLKGVANYAAISARPPLRRRRTSSKEA